MTPLSDSAIGSKPTLDQCEGFIDLVVHYMRLHPKATWTEAAATAASDVLSMHRKHIHRKLFNV